MERCCQRNRQSTSRLFPLEIFLMGEGCGAFHVSQSMPGVAVRVGRGAEPRAAVDWGCKGAVKGRSNSGEGLLLQELHMGLCVGLKSRVPFQPILLCDYVFILGNNAKFKPKNLCGFKFQHEKIQDYSPMVFSTWKSQMQHCLGYSPV